MTALLWIHNKHTFGNIFEDIDKCQIIYFNITYCRNQWNLNQLSYGVIFCCGREKTYCKMISDVYFSYLRLRVDKILIIPYRIINFASSSYVVPMSELAWSTQCPAVHPKHNCVSVRHMQVKILGNPKFSQNVSLSIQAHYPTSWLEKRSQRQDMRKPTIPNPRQTSKRVIWIGGCYT